MMNVDEITMSLSEIADQPTEDGMVDGVSQQTIRDALELINYQHEHIEAFLRDQEPIAPRRIDGKKNHFIKCGNCNIDLMTGDIFCPKCGRRLKWK